MATHDYVIDNSTGANVRADLNLVLQAVLTNNSNSSSPSTTAAYMFWVDTTANIVKIRNASDNAWINLFTTAGGIDVDAASNFNEDVTFTGAAANIVFDKSDNALEFNDDAKATFGTGGDLQIFHDASFSRIKDTGANALIFQSGEHRIQNEAANETMAKFIGNGAVELYFDNSKKFETTSAGITVTGDLTFSDSTANDINLRGGKIYGDDGASNELEIRSTSGNANHARIVLGESFGSDNGGITFYGAGSSSADVKLRVRGNTDTVEISDSHKFVCGDGSDLQIYHDGSNSYIANTTGTLLLQNSAQTTVKGSTVAFENAAGSEVMLKAIQNSSNELYFDNTKRFETLTDGSQCRGVMHVLSQDGNVTQHTEALYYVIGTNSSTTFTLTGMVGSGRFVLGGYANAGQGALALNVFLGGAMFATQHYNVNELQTSGMQNISVSTSKNNTSYVVTISNSSSSYGLGISGFIESTGAQITVTAS